METTVGPWVSGLWPNFCPAKNFMFRVFGSNLTEVESTWTPFAFKIIRPADLQSLRWIMNIAATVLFFLTSSHSRNCIFAQFR